MGFIKTTDEMLDGSTELYFAVIRDSYGEKWLSSEPSSTSITGTFEYALGYVRAFLTIFEDKLIGEVDYTTLVKELVSIVVQTIDSLSFDVDENLIPLKYHFKHNDLTGGNDCVMSLDTENLTFDLDLNVGGSRLTISIYGRSTEYIHFLGIE